MALQDILDRAFAGEAASAKRQPDLDIGPPPEEEKAVAFTPPTPPPVESGSPNMAALALSLLGQQKQGGGGGGQGLSNFDAGAGGTTALARRIGSWIDSRPGFTVGGLEGYNGTGQISTGHIENSQHYTGHAGDVSYVGGGKFGGVGNENAALDWLYNKLNRRWGDYLTELLWEVPNHWDHLHYGTRPGG